MANPFLPEQIRWRQIFSLAAVQGGMSLSWLAYGLYLPKLIEQGFAYSPSDAGQLTALILIVENAIAMVIEPVFGSLSDRFKRFYGSKVPFLVVGAIGATALFMAIPYVFLFGGANDFTRFLLLGLAILWAFLMATFRAPALSLLGGFAPIPQLPLAACFLTLIGGLVGAIKPLATSFVLSLGAPATFTIASLAFIASVVSLRSAMQAMPPTQDLVEALNPEDLKPEAVVPIRRLFNNIVTVMFVGATIGLGSRLLMGDVVPRLLKADITGLTGLSLEVLTGLVLITQAFLALVTGQRSQFIDNRKLLVLSLGGIALGLGMLAIGMGPIVTFAVMLFILLCLSAVNNGMVPFALTMVPKNHSGLTVGLFFGGVSGANALFSYLVPKPSILLATQTSMLITTIALLSAGLGIVYGALGTRK
jgi:Major Facilitator Superfamily